MRRSLVVRTLVLSLMAISLGSFSAVSWSQEPSNLAFELKGVKDKVSLQQFAGKFVYVDFWASWCAPCKQSFPFLNGLQKKYGAAGLQIIAINVDKKIEDANTFLTQTPAQFLIAFDAEGNVPKQYGVKGMPSSYFIGRDGKLIFIHKGFKPQDQDAIEAKIKAAIEMKENK